MNNLYWCSFAGYGHIVTGEDEAVGVVVTFAHNPQAALDHALTFVPKNYRELEAAVLLLELEDIVRFRDDQMDTLLTDPRELQSIGASKMSGQEILGYMEWRPQSDMN